MTKNLSQGIGSATARVAALIAPFIGDWIEVSPFWPYIIVGKWLTLVDLEINLGWNIISDTN